MTQADPELQVLLNTHEFFLRVVGAVLGHEIPLPESLQGARIDPGVLTRWLNLLDLAITAPMMRDALRQNIPTATAASLLRYYTGKQRHSDTDRDKTDFVVTHLFRSPASPELWDARGLFFGGGKTYPPFESALMQMLGLQQSPPLAEEHRQLVREFEFMAEEVEDYRHFDALIDSGVMQRVRDIKHSLGVSFYHPHVLSIVAAYNVFFGTRFDRLFHEATQQIKSFAEKVKSEGGSIMTRVDGDVIVKQLADVEERRILQTEYGKAQDQFRQLSKFKKAVDHRRGTREAPAAMAASAPAPVPPVMPKRTPAIMPPSPIELNGTSASVAEHVESAPTLSGEEVRLKSMAETIRNFVRAADPKSAHIVPVRHGNIVLTPPETDAFRADYTGEKSFRADYVNAMVSIVSLIGRMQAELADFKAKRNSAYLWKPHADSLSYMLKMGREIDSRAMVLAELAERRGLVDKMNAVNQSLAKLREQVQIVAEALQTLDTGKRDAY